jgi:hypothetical protein
LINERFQKLEERVSSLVNRMIALEGKLTTLIEKAKPAVEAVLDSDKRIRCIERRVEELEDLKMPDRIAAVATMADRQIQDLRKTVTPFVRQMKSDIQNRKIRVLHVQPDPTKFQTGEEFTDFKRIMDGVGPEVRIEVQTIDAIAFAAQESEAELVAFDIIFIGGRDCSSQGLTALTDEVVNRTLKPFLDDGGAILLFHDTEGNGCQFLYEQFQFRHVQPLEFHNATVMRQSRITTMPFRLDQIEFQGTHGGYAADPRYTVLAHENLSYYSRVGRLGHTQMCHKPPQGKAEWKLLVNIVYDLCSPRRVVRVS